MKTALQKRPSTQSPLPLDAPLSPQWAFVVQFRAAPNGPTYPAGRIEHMSSGRTAHFQSLEELVTYLTEELRATTTSQ